jgi:hypothetical protein
MIPDVPECIEGEFEYTVEEILHHRYVPYGKKNKHDLEYLVR